MQKKDSRTRHADCLEGDKRVVTDVYLLRNVDESREHFSMDPAEQLAAIKDIRQKKGVLLGNFHSHPESPSRPSQEDIRLAYDPKMNYLILSLMFSQTMFFLTDYIDIEAIQALKESVRIMRGKKGKLFYLQLSFIGIYLLGVYGAPTLLNTDLTAGLTALTQS